MFFFGILYLFIHRGKVPFVKGGNWYANMEDVFSCTMRDMCRLEGGGGGGKNCNGKQNWNPKCEGVDEVRVSLKLD